MDAPVETPEVVAPVLRPTLREFFAARGLTVTEMRDENGKVLDPDALRYLGEYVNGPDGRVVRVSQEGAQHGQLVG